MIKYSINVGFIHQCTGSVERERDKRELAEKEPRESQECVEIELRELREDLS